jgi:hypothetical protein
MTNPIAVVRPGDLIRADEYNVLIALVNDLDARVQRLESQGGGPTGRAPVIMAVNPISPHINDTVVVTGQTFDYSVGAARVSVDGLNCTLLAGSSDTVLIFQMPALASVPDGGRTAQLLVQNLQLSASRSLLVLPATTPVQGNVSLQFQGTDPERITANQPCSFHYRAVSSANQPVTLTLIPTASVPAWQAGLQVLDDTRVVLPSNALTVGTLLSKDFFVQIAQVTAPTTTFTLTVNAQGQGIVTSSGAQSFTVGQIGTQDPDTQLSVQGVTRGGQGPNPFSDLTITLKTNEGAEIDLLVGFAKAGKFDLTATVSPAVAGWTVTQGATTTFTIADTDIPTSGGFASRAVKVVIKAPAAAASADLNLVLQRQGGTVPRQVTLHLVAQA